MQFIISIYTKIIIPNNGKYAGVLFNWLQNIPYIVWTKGVDLHME